MLSHSLKGTIGYVKVRYEGGESSKVGHSLRQRVLQCEGWNVLPWTAERGGLRKERWYVADQLVYKTRLRVRRRRQLVVETRQQKSEDQQQKKTGVKIWTENRCGGTSKKNR